MKKQQMLDRIYEVISDKTISFWCLLTIHRGDSKTQTRFVRDERHWGEWFTITEDWSEIQQNLPHSKMYTTYQIIWHPIMIGDVLDWLYENDIDQVELHKLIERKWIVAQFTYTPASVMVISLWKEKRKPIDDQSDQLIKFVYDLLPTK